MGIRGRCTHTHTTHTSTPAATGRLKIAGIRTLRCELWSADYPLSLSFSVFPPFHPTIRPSVRPFSRSSRKYPGPPASVSRRTRQTKPNSLSVAGHSAMFLAFSWTVAIRAARFHFILANTLRKTTARWRRRHDGAQLERCHRLYLLILDVNRRRERASAHRSARRRRRRVVAGDCRRY